MKFSVTPEDAAKYADFALEIQQRKRYSRVTYSPSILSFRSTGFDKGDEVSGDGTVELQEGDTIGLELSLTPATTPSSRRAVNELFNSLVF